ncbi:MAG: ATP-dependent 6-phosphofructokinase, partial [Chloroflexota bacterium]|nr:ATP-dependent 6-phosphofructokinase [Chloroflexota bacterium]
MAVRRVGVLVSGGDCPGLNAVLRAVVKVGISEFGLEVVGIQDGYSGLLEPVRARALGAAEVSGLLSRGGTILGSTNRGNPFHWESGPHAGEDRSTELIGNAKRLGLDCVIVIGGDGSLRIGLEFAARGLPIVGVPKTIDNDIDLTDATFGFDSAVTVAMEAIDRLHTTAESHHRVMVVEVMGREAGWIALSAGLAGGADAILIPEIPFSLHSVGAKILERVRSEKPFSIVVVAEGATSLDGEASYLDDARKRFGGVGQKVGLELERLTQKETRVT